ncbi:MAG: hypothetical protein COS99_06645 [Candidatus Omnitrophica bacterium CG07_land_8_20_14_0_80_42_15]|uniref:Uncharacterized protein n=1 Tax=Candidatus Aquitaenariimonas noxiae TaxID=1974741 RepID=A0A2J0L3W3_9BACT|nr:MAG: hypothetical protein COS99_06645 [Candidatus Omnitrophica bacterium CG07_land_8_20_14_0_80_42_15]
MRNALKIIAVLVLGVACVASAAFAATSDTVSVTATVGAGTSSVAITQTAIAFGTVAGTQTNHRFHAGPMTVTYYAGTDAWTIRTFTDNSPLNGAEPEKAGLKGADGTTYMPLKAWNANFGGTGIPPNEESDANWAGADAVWLRIPEKDEHTTDPGTWRRLCYKGAELAPGGFANYLGIDVSSVKAQAYTTTLTVEIINQ